jgi:hypothetical protein
MLLGANRFTGLLFGLATLRLAATRGKKRDRFLIQSLLALQPPNLGGLDIVPSKVRD